MPATIVLSPATTTPGGHVTVNLAGLKPNTKVDLTTVDTAGRETGKGTDLVRPSVEGTVEMGVLAPMTVGACKVRAYQGNSKVAEAVLTVQPAQVAITISGITVSVTETTAVIAWDCSPAATGQVRYGATTAYGQTSAKETSLLTHHVQTITGLLPDTWYHFAVVAEAGGTVKVSVDGTFRTAAVVEPPPPPIKSVRVTSIASLLSTLGDNTVDEIVVANGVYSVAPAGQAKANSLWIGGVAGNPMRQAIVNRTRPITVRAETIGGVTFDGGGQKAFGGLSFEDGAHHQTWDGFRFRNMVVEYTGVIEFGGYEPRRTPHHITVRNMTVEASCIGRATTNSGKTWDHAVYLAHAVGEGPNEIVIENLTVEPGGNLASAIHAYHGDAANPGSHHVTVRNLVSKGVQSHIILWLDGIHDYLFEGADLADAKRCALQFASRNARNIVFRDVVSVRSGARPIDDFLGLGMPLPGVTFIDCSLG